MSKRARCLAREDEKAKAALEILPAPSVRADQKRECFDIMFVCFASLITPIPNVNSLASQQLSISAAPRNLIVKCVVSYFEKRQILIEIDCFIMYIFLFINITRSLGWSESARHASVVSSLPRRLASSTTCRILPSWLPTHRRNQSRAHHHHPKRQSWCNS